MSTQSQSPESALDHVLSILGYGPDHPVTRALIDSGVETIIDFQLLQEQDIRDLVIRRTRTNTAGVQVEVALSIPIA